MRALWAVLACLGLTACDAPQPDVSAHTLLNLLIQTKGNPEVLPITLGALYEHVAPHGPQSREGTTEISLRLGRGQDRDIANLQCVTADQTALNAKADDWPVLPNATKRAFKASLSIGTNLRVFCTFHYADRTARVRAFLRQVDMFAASHIGVAHPDAFPDGQVARTATAADPSRALTFFEMDRRWGKTATIFFIFDIR